MSKNDRAVLNAVLRNDFSAFLQRSFQTVVPGQPFLSNWHIDAINHQLERCRRGEIRKLLITVPPRSTKSICASVAFPAFVLGHDPKARVVCVSYSQELSAKLSRDSRAVIESPWYREAFPQTRIDPRKNSETEFETTARGYRLSTSVGGTLTGRGGNYIIIDDPMKPGEAASETKRAAVIEFYDSTLVSRLDDKTEGVIIVIMQRLHVGDLIGHIIEKDPGWTHLNLPAIADVPQDIAIDDDTIYRRRAGELLHPEREPQFVLDELKISMGSQAFSAQYQQMPIPPGGALIREEWLQKYACAPERRPGDQIIQSWDTASKVSEKNDYSVCTTCLVRGSDYYVLDVFRARLEFPDLMREVVRREARFNATAVLIGDAASGTGLIQALRSDRRVQPIPIRAKGDKIERLEAQSAVIEAGRVRLPEAAPWLEDFKLELLAFPYGRFDDQVDSLSQLLGWAEARRRRHTGIVAMPVIIDLGSPGERW